jgi:hypothetical protein
MKNLPMKGGSGGWLSIVHWACNRASAASAVNDQGNATPAFQT